MDWMGWLIGLFVFLFVVVNFLPLLRARSARGRAVPDLDALLTDDQRRLPRLLVYFWSPSCGPCRAMTPVIDRLAAERGSVVKVNIVESTDLARQFGVMATPSLAVVEKGVVVRLAVGAKTAPQILALLAS
jgi:thioredoxin 1